MKITFLFRCSFKGAMLVCFMDWTFRGECPFLFLRLFCYHICGAGYALHAYGVPQLLRICSPLPPSAAIRGAHAPHSGSFALQGFSGGLAAVTRLQTKHERRKLRIRSASSETKIYLFYLAFAKPQG